jgi:hypothetical protein
MIGIFLVLNSSSFAEDCCTPEVTAKIAASAGFLDVVGIKLGTGAKQAMELMKAANPAFKIDLVKIDLDWDYLTKRIIGSSGPKKQWVYAIKGEVAVTGARGGEMIVVALTLPPSPQVAFYLGRWVEFPTQATPTIDNVLAGLRKKYGPPSYEQLIGIPQLRWIFDSQGQLIERSRKENGLPIVNCQGLLGDKGGLPVWDLSPPASGFRGKTRVTGLGPQCESFVIVEAKVSPTTTGGNMAAQVGVSATHFPLYSSGVNTTNAALDHLLKQYDDKKLQDAGKVDAPKF